MATTVTTLDMQDELIQTREGMVRYSAYLRRAQARAARVLGHVAKWGGNVGGAARNVRKAAATQGKTFSQTSLNASKQAFQSNGRYLAYASDVGEAFRPLVWGPLVWGGYGIEIAYVITDVTMCGLKAKKMGKDVVRAVSHASAFQGIASIIVPGVVIHQTVHAAQKICAARAAPVWLPSAIGLAVIPALPKLDHPIEHAIDASFEKYWPEASSETKALEDAKN
eukprot:834810-Pyramimonas_sp.AAC.3